MPQPLSSFSNTGSLFFGSQLIAERPQLAIKISTIVGSWSLFEAALGEVLACFLEIKAEVGVAMYASLTGGQEAALDAAANLVLNEEDKFLYLALRKLSNSPRKKRNAIVHGIWGICGMQDAILIQSSKSFMAYLAAVEGQRHQIEQERATRKWPPDDLERRRKSGDMTSIYPHPQPDESEIMVYRESDFDSLISEINKVAQYWRRFIWIASRFSKYDQERLALYSEQDVHETLDRIKKSQKGAPVPPQ